MEVIGHYVFDGGAWTAQRGAGNSPLFEAVVVDDANTVKWLLDSDASLVNAHLCVLYTSATDAELGQEDNLAKLGTDQNCRRLRSHVVKQRTLAMIAAYHGSLRTLELLLARGATVAAVSQPEGWTCKQFAELSTHHHAEAITETIEDAAAGVSDTCQLPRQHSFAAHVSPRQHEPAEAASHPACRSTASAGTSYQDMRSLGSSPLKAAPDTKPGSQAAVNTAPESRPGDDASCPCSGPYPYSGPLPYSTAELTRPEFSTDSFRMFCFKIVRCSKRYTHDWRACPFAHPTENARRRDPREVRYCTTACPDYKQGLCIRGDACHFSHGVFESWLHPSRYRTQLCKDGASCARAVCFFAHSLQQLRTPTHTHAPASTSGGAVPPLTPAGLDLAGGAVAGLCALQPASPDAQGPRDQMVGSSAASSSPADAARMFLGSFVAGGSSASLLDLGRSSSTAELAAPGAGRAAHGADVFGLAGGAACGAASFRPSSAGSGDGPGSAPPCALPRGCSSDGSWWQQGQPPSEATAGGAVSLPLPQRPGAPLPRMSNAFARRHGLNPKDNPLINLQRVSALQQQAFAASALAAPGGAVPLPPLPAPIGEMHCLTPAGAGGGQVRAALGGTAGRAPRRRRGRSRGSGGAGAAGGSGATVVSAFEAAQYLAAQQAAAAQGMLPLAALQPGLAYLPPGQHPFLFGTPAGPAAPSQLLHHQQQVTPGAGGGVHDPMMLSLLFSQLGVGPPHLHQPSAALPILSPGSGQGLLLPTTYPHHLPGQF